MKTDEELLEMARAVVPEHLHVHARIVRHGAATDVRVAGMENHRPDLVAAIAEEVGTTLGEGTEDSADVEFVDDTRLGNRATVVQIRDGEVAKVLKRA